MFHFADAGATPQSGSTYTLISFASVSGFSAGDLSYHYSGAAGARNRHFVLNATSPQFVLDANSQTITFTSPGTQLLSNGSLTFIPTDSGGLPVTLVSSTMSMCTVNGSGPFTLTLVDAGTWTLTASHDGDTTFAAATAVTISFSVQAAPVATLTPTPAMSERMLLPLGPLLDIVGIGWRRRSKAQGGSVRSGDRRAR